MNKQVIVERQDHMYLTTLLNKRQVEVKVISGRVQALVVDVSGLYLRATNLQGASCIRSCTTFSVLVKETDKNIFGECGALENPRDTHTERHTHTHTHTHTHVPPTRPTHNVSSHITIFHIITHTLQ